MRTGKIPTPRCSNLECESCTKSKQHRTFKESLTSDTNVGNLHDNTKRKVETTSTDGHHHFLTVVGEYSWFTTVFELRSKGESADVLLRLMRFLEKQSGHYVRSVHTDGGSELKRELPYLAKTV